MTVAAGNSLSANNSFDFFFLNADANRDRAVNALDFNALATNFGRTGRNFAQGNFNYDSQVNTLDFNVLASRFNKTLPQAAPPLAAVALSASSPTGSLFAVVRIDDPDRVDSLLQASVQNHAAALTK